MCVHVGVSMCGIYVCVVRVCMCVHIWDVSVHVLYMWRLCINRSSCERKRETEAERGSQVQTYMGTVMSPLLIPSS